jgi:hypothetical protein
MVPRVPAGCRGCRQYAEAPQRAKQAAMPDGVAGHTALKARNIQTPAALNLPVMDWAMDWPISGCRCPWRCISTGTAGRCCLAQDPARRGGART